jgi:hypothetical protein
METQFQQDTSSNKHSNKLFEHLRDVILLDTGSTLKATFMNPELVTDIRATKTPVSMTTNTGTKKIELEAAVPGFGPTWFDPTQIANIYGFSHMADEHCITYDSDKEDAFLVHSKNVAIKFERTQDNLYVYKPTAKFKEQLAKLKETSSPNEYGEQYTTNLIATV